MSERTPATDTTLEESEILEEISSDSDSSFVPGNSQRQNRRKISSDSDSSIERDCRQRDNNTDSDSSVGRTNRQRDNNTDSDSSVDRTNRQRDNNTDSDSSVGRTNRQRDNNTDSDSSVGRTNRQRDNNTDSDSSVGRTNRQRDNNTDSDSSVGRTNRQRDNNTDSDSSVGRTNRQRDNNTDSYSSVGRTNRQRDNNTDSDYSVGRTNHERRSRKKRGNRKRHTTRKRFTGISSSESSANRNRNNGPRKNRKSDSTGSDSSFRSNTSTVVQNADANSFKVLRNGKPHSAAQLYSEVMHKDDVLEQVPPGEKSNVYFLVDNSRNIELNANGQRSNFYDDCGVWNSKKAMSVKSHHIVSERLKQVYLKNGIFCTSTTSKGKTSWVPVSPQPDSDDVVTLHKYYTSLKANEKYKKRVTWFTSEALPDIANVAVYEYIGKYEIADNDHSATDYVRTNPKIFERISSELEKRKTPTEIYRDEIKINDSFNAPRDTKQIRNFKYRKESRKTQILDKNNVADEILQVIGMLNDHAFVQEIIHSKNQVPSIICYTKEQIEVRPLSVSDTFDVSDTYLKIIIEPNRIILKFRFATIHIRQKIQCL